MSELESGASTSPGASESTSSQTSTATTTSNPSSESQATSKSTAPTSIAALKTLSQTMEASQPQGKTTEGATPTADAAAAAAYTPNFKFKYLDPEANKQMEKEVDDWAKALIKDKETEEKFSKLYAKAFGLDAAVGARDKYKTEASTLRKEIGDTKKSLNMLSGYVQGNDMHSFFQALKIPEDKVLKYALERVQYREWTPEQRAAYDSQRDTQSRAQFLEEQNQLMYQQMQSTAVQSRSTELEQVMSDPQVVQAAEAFDKRMGSGAFKNEVIRRGQLYWHQFQKDIPAHQAVNEVFQMIGGAPQPAAAPVQMAPEMNTNSQPGIQMGSNPTPEKRKPIIPNIQGSGASPAKKIPRSIDDLKKIREQMEA